jgi:cytochrome c
MKNTAKILLVSAAALSLAACSSEPQEPVEQIIVREASSPDQAITTAGTITDLADLAASGKAAFAACAACHSVQPDGASGVGPNLYGVVGRAAGSLGGYVYSDALVTSGLTWDEAALDGYIANPSAAVPGTNMVAGAEVDVGRREAIIAYLTSLAE